MKKTVLLLAGLPLLLLAEPLGGQDLDESVRTLARENTRLYAGPIASGLGAGLSSAWYRTSGVRGVGEFYVGLDVMGAWVPEADKSFRPVLPSSITVQELGGETYTDPYGSSAGRSTPSAAGDGSGAVFEPEGEFRQDLVDAGQTPSSFALRFPEGLGFFAVPSFMPRLTVGVPGSTELTLRYLPSVRVVDELDEVSALGFGARHQLNRWLPGSFPLDLSVAGGYQTLDLGELVSTEIRTLQLVAGRDFNLVALYGGLRWEDSETTVRYTVENQRLPDDRSTVEVEADGANGLGLTVGATLDLVMKMNVSYTLADYSVLTAGAGFGI